MSGSLRTGNSAESEGLHWHQLEVLLQSCPETAEKFLHLPPPAGMPSRETIDTVLGRAEANNLAELAEKHLLCGLLPGPGRKQLFRSGAAERLIDRHLKAVEPDIAFKCQWMPVPVLVVLKKQARIVWMMLGQTTYLDECRCVATPVPDAQTMQAITAACRLGDRSHGFLYCFLQDSRKQPVGGSSLSLPIALAARLLQQGRPWPRGVYATGSVASEGTIQPVAGILEKHHIAQASSSRLFLMPGGGKPTESGLKNSHICATFADACFAVDLYTTGIPADKTAIYQACRYSIRALLVHFHELPLPFLKAEQCGHLIRQAVGDPQLYLEPLSVCLQRCSHDRKRGRLLAELFAPELLAGILESKPELSFDAFHWCLARISYANHSGQVSDSTDWISFAGQMLHAVDPEEAGKLLNHGFVSGRFNRYDFRPDPGPEFTTLIEDEEKRQAAFPGSNYLLGSLYGTLAQNYGFCGPAHLTALQETISRAEAAFGGKNYREKERLSNYRIYALLDCEMTAEAITLLNVYLNLDPAAGRDAWLRKMGELCENKNVADAFKAAVTVRVLADTEPLPPSPQRNWFKIVAAVLEQTSHPWQLIALNLGRILLKEEQMKPAEELLRHSLRICQAGGDTLFPMGLLPLAELHRFGLGQKNDYAKVDEITLTLRGTTAVNRDHFRLILDLDSPEKLLEKVMEKRSVLFPFSYR